MAKFQFPPLASLRAFEAAARLESFELASVELHVTRAAISKHVRMLEREIGWPLFTRSRRKIKLNEDGHSLSIEIRQALATIERAMIQVKKEQRPERLVISVDPDFAGLWLVPRLAEFYAIVPNVLIEIWAEKGAPATHDPRISCVIYYAEVGAALAEREMLFQSRLFPVCAKNRVSSPPLNRIEDLSFHTLLHDRSVSEWAEYVSGSGGVADLNLNSGILFSDTALCLDAAVRGQGVAIGDDFLAGRLLSEGRLTRPFGSAVWSKNAYYLRISETAATHPSVNVFRMWLLQCIRSQREEFGSI